MKVELRVILRRFILGKFKGLSSRKTEGESGVAFYFYFFGLF